MSMFKTLLAFLLQFDFSYDQSFIALLLFSMVVTLLNIPHTKLLPRVWSVSEKKPAPLIYGSESHPRKQVMRTVTWGQ